MKIFLDANILFSASNTASALYRLLQHLRQEHTLAGSHYAINEAQRNLTIKRSDWSEAFEQWLTLITVCLQTKLSVDVVLAEKDRPILAAAIAGQCDYLLTGDKKDFHHLFGQTIAGVHIMAPAELAEALL